MRYSPMAITAAFIPSPSPAQLDQGLTAVKPMDESNMDDQLMANNHDCISSARSRSVDRLFLNTVVSEPQVTAEPVLVTAPQQSLGGPSAGATGSCGGCFIVADVQGIVWYSEVFAYTAATAFVSIATGNTTGRSTSTSIVENTEKFTFRLGSTGVDQNLALTPVTYDSTVNLNGVILTSPTAYNVFTAYAINRQTLVEGNCMTLTGATTTLVTPYLETITSPEGIVTLDAAGEQKFVTDVLQITTCSGQDVNIVPSAFVPVTSITATVTQNHQTVSRAFASLTIAPTSTPFSKGTPVVTTITSVFGSLTAVFNATVLADSAPASGTSASEAESEPESGSGSGSTAKTVKTTKTTYPYASAPLIIIGSSTITPDGNPVNLPFYSAATTVGSASGRVVVVVSTGTGSVVGNYTATVVPYVSEAGSWRRGHFWTSLWAATLSGLGLVMVWL